MMDQEFGAALRYLSKPAGSFWNWTENGNVIAWRQGATLVFREELAMVLEPLAARGLPPLDAVLLLIASTRPQWNENSSVLRKQLSDPQTQLGSLNALGQSAIDILNLLDQVRGLPLDLIQSADAKGAFAAVVFESAQRVTTPKVAQFVCEVLAKNLAGNRIPNLPLLTGGRSQTRASLIRDLWSLAAGLDDLNAERLRHRLNTGIEEQPMPAEIEVPAEPSAIQSLLRELALDDELHGLSRIARNLSAVLQLPRGITDSDEMPLGGVSDIANRGTLDRLLLSELANDDLLLATRVALNEALYLRREAPPSQPPQRRYVLMDSGLRTWGLPRIFSTATMLALGAIGEAKSSLMAYRAAGDRAVPIDPSTREGLATHLNALEPDIHPGSALSDFLDRMTHDEQPGDAVVITTDTAYADPEFRKILRERLQEAATKKKSPHCYVGTVNRDGDFELWSHSARGAKRISVLKLDLEDLLKPPVRTNRELVDETIDPELPAIFRMARFPFRLPHIPRKVADISKEVVWSVREPTGQISHRLVNANEIKHVLIASDSSPATSRKYGVLNLSRDHRLIHFDDSKRGGVQVAIGVPFGSLLWSGSSRDDHLSYALIYRRTDATFHLIVVNVVLNQLVITRKLDSKFVSHAGAGAKVLGAASHLGILYVIYQTAIEAFGLAEGRFLHKLSFDEHFQWSGGRFIFRSRSAAWHAISFDGTQIVLEQVPHHKFGGRGLCLRIFDRDGHDGPFGVFSNGFIINLSNDDEWEWVEREPAGRVLDCDGDRLLITRREAARPAVKLPDILVDLDTRKIENVGSHFETLAQYDFNRIRPSGNLMHRFVQILVGTDDGVTLVSKSQRWQFVARGNVLRMNMTGGVNVRSRAHFERSRLSNGGLDMTVATWSDGSRILIDSRGIMHLQSSDRTIREASLVLNENSVSVWISDGRVCGPPNCIDDPQAPTITPTEFMETILKPFAQRLPGVRGRIE